MNNNLQKAIILMGAVAIVLIAFFMGTHVGSKRNGQSLAPENVDFDPFWGAWQIIEEKYVDSEKIENKNMVYGAISGLLKSLGDPYTVFFTPEELKEFEIEINGEFEGVGMEVGIRKDILTVVAPLKGTPAEKAGIMAGDRILRIDEEPTSDLTIEEAVRLIRGVHGTEVKLTILRNGEEATRIIPVIRDVIKIPTLDTETKISVKENGQKKEIDTGDVFIIKLYNFSENSANYFRQALREFIDSKKQKLILDLRNNPGGYLEASVDIASWFLPQGETIVTEDFGGKAPQKIHRSKGYDLFNNLPMIVLVNKGSASASEIVAGALQDHGIAKIVGEKTFGKGSVQELVPLTGNTSIKITIAKWLTPNGKSISDGGLTPDIELNIKAEEGEDPVMKKALELLK